MAREEGFRTRQALSLNRENRIPLRVIASAGVGSRFPLPSVRVPDQAAAEARGRKVSVGQWVRCTGGRPEGSGGVSGGGLPAIAEAESRSQGRA